MKFSSDSIVFARNKEPGFLAEMVFNAAEDVVNKRKLCDSFEVFEVHESESLVLAAREENFFVFGELEEEDVVFVVFGEFSDAFEFEVSHIADLS